MSWDGALSHFDSSKKQVVLVELTVLWEVRMEEANEKKRAKYEGRMEECRIGLAGAIRWHWDVGDFAGRSHSNVHSLKLITKWNSNTREIKQ